MKKIMGFVLLLLLSAGLFAQEFKKAEGIDMVFQWRFVEAGLEVRLTGPTTGWIAVGFDPDNMMQGADFKIGYVNADGKAEVFDHYGHTRIGHQSDEKNKGSENILNIGGSEKNGITEISFVLPLNSGDPNDKVFIKGNTYKVLLAYGSSDRLTKHVKRTSLMVKLD